MSVTFCVNACTDARGRRRRFNIGRVLVLNTPPALLSWEMTSAVTQSVWPRAQGPLDTALATSQDVI